MDAAAQAAARAELEADLVALRRHGVKFFTQHGDTGGFTVEFWPAAAEKMPELDKNAAKNDPDVCKCGHPQHAHMNGYCVEGCAPTVCEPEKKP